VYFVILDLTLAQKSHKFGRGLLWYYFVWNGFKTIFKKGVVVAVIV